MALRAFGLALLGWAAIVVPSTAADLVPRKAPAAGASDDETFDVELKSFVMSDYIYRGVSLSQRKPSAGASVEAQLYSFYVGANVQSVDLPTQPASEVTWSAGYRWSVAGFDLDLGANYFWYPGEILAPGQPATSYWEYAFDVERKLIEGVKVEGVLGYSPNVSGSGAWGAYAEASFEIDLPRLQVLRDVKWQLVGNAGYWRFGDTSAAQGGLPLPAYANWRLGLVLTLREHLSLDLSYWDTNLSKEDCFVLTGDTMATPGGVANPINNPDGLRSRLCGATLVGTLTAKFDLSELK